MINRSDHASLKNFESLISAIERKECTVFIGAGLSMPIGYPSLQELLHCMATEANIPHLEAKEVDDSWPTDFQIIKDALGLPRYQRVLNSIFDHTQKDLQYNPILINILNVPFCGFVTTNYDPCLEFAAMNLSSSSKGYSFAYPNLPTTQLTGKHIFHLHGYKDPNNPDSINTIILAQDEFIEAYEQTQTTSMFLRTLFEELDVLFIGFGWNDLVILNILDRVKQLREIREDIAVKRNYQLSRERSKFAIIDNETYQRYIDGANYIGRLGIKPIIYQKVGDSHYLLNQIIREIQLKTSKQTISPIPTVPEDFLEPLGELYG